MDPVVIMERLPETVVQYYLQKLKNNGYFDCSNWSFEKFKKNKKAHHRKKKQKKINAENPFDSETNEWEILNKNTSSVSDNSEKSNLVHIMRQSKVHDEQVPIETEYSSSIPNEIIANLSIERINGRNEIDCSNNEENISIETEMHMNSLQNAKISAPNPMSSDCSDNFFSNEEWQIISEASCSDVSRSSTPYDEECSYKPVNETDMCGAELSDKPKLSSNLQNEQLTNKNDNYKNIVLSKCYDVYAFDEDDKLTEPYKSDCEDNDANSPLNLKISDTSEQYSENSYKSHKDECVSNSSSKDEDKMTERNMLSDENDSHELQISLDTKSHINQYDVVGHIIKTMDKSFSTTKRLSMETNENESTRSSDVERSPVRSDSSVICSLKQKKARMSMGLSKVLYHIDSSSDDTTFSNSSIKKLSLPNMTDLRYSSFSKEDSIPDLKSKESDVLSDDTESHSKKISKRKSNILFSSDIKKVKLHILKKSKSCWRCGKKYLLQHSSDRLCKQCNSLDYTKLNNNLKCHSDGECISDKETVAGDQSDHSTVSEPCFSNFKLYKRFVKEDKTEQVSKTSKEPGLLSSAKDLSDKTNTFHNNPMDLSTNKQGAEDKSTAVPPLKLIVSLNQKNLNSVDIGKNKFDLKLKKQRRKTSNLLHKTYKIHNIAPNSEHRENENLICKILRKRKHKDMLKKRKKSKDNTDYEAVENAHSESSYSERYESKVKKLKISKTTSELIPIKDAAQSENSESMQREQNDKTSENPEREKNKKGTCEVISVNRGLFLLSFPEADDDLDPNIFAFPEKPEIQNGETDISLKISSKEQTAKDDLQKTDDASSVNVVKDVKDSEKVTSEYTTNTTIINIAAPTTAVSITAVAENLTTSNDRHNKEVTPVLQTTDIPLDDMQEKSSESFSDNALQLQTDPLDLMTKTVNSKNNELASSVVISDKDLSANKSIPKIENVFSLRDMPIERLQEKHLRPNPTLNNCNVYNELDAYATASILELEQSQEHSVVLLTSILAREFKELQKINLMEKASQFSAELYKVKMRKIDTIRSLQLACALLTKGQKCKKELSPNMLNMTSEEMTQLLALCNDMYHSKLSEILSKPEESSQSKSGSDKIDSNDLSKKNGVIPDIAQQTINIQNTINSLLMPPVLNPITVIPTMTNYSPHPNFPHPQSIPTAVSKSDDDVICLGTSSVRTSVIQPKEQITLSKVSQNKQFQVPVNNKDERIGNLTAKHAITLSELAKTNNLQVETSASVKSSSQSINKILAKNNQVTVNIVNNTPIYQKVSFGFNESGNYASPANQSSNTTPRTADERKQSPQLQLDKAVTSNWGPTNNTTEGRNISRIQNQWTSQSLGKQGITITQTTNDRNAGSPAWRNNVSAHNAVSVPNQQRPIQPNIRPTTLVPIVNQFGTLISRPPLLQGPVHAGRNIASVPMFNIHTQGVIRTWHQPPNAPAQVSSHQSSQSPIVCITCRKPISMTCPTGMFCSELCKKTYCAMFPNYR